ncbi:MAG TPA: BlaI/MecI/CopY family transcriptional regulator [Blastococcus sp.]|nr:BlaI/MecI/CopY family transcriptional regulator [Blastococcus sp.]
MARGGLRSLFEGLRLDAGGSYHGGRPSTRVGCSHEGSTMTTLRQAVPRGADRASRRANGELQAAVMRALWDAGRPLNAAEIRDFVGSSSGVHRAPPAYTTVVTTLTRLQQKGTLRRERHGRAYSYVPTADNAGMAARRMAGLLDAAQDRDTVLMRFVTDLSSRDEQLLRALLERQTPTQDADG